MACFGKIHFLSFSFLQTPHHCYAAWTNVNNIHFGRHLVSLNQDLLNQWTDNFFNLIAEKNTPTVQCSNEVTKIWAASVRSGSDTKFLNLFALHFKQKYSPTFSFGPFIPPPGEAPYRTVLNCGHLALPGLGLVVRHLVGATYEANFLIHLCSCFSRDIHLVSNRCIQLAFIHAILYCTAQYCTCKA